MKIRDWRKWWVISRINLYLKIVSTWHSQLQSRMEILMHVLNKAKNWALDLLETEMIRMSFSYRLRANMKIVKLGRKIWKKFMLMTLIKLSILKELWNSKSTSWKKFRKARHRRIHLEKCWKKNWWGHRKKRTKLKNAVKFLNRNL